MLCGNIFAYHSANVFRHKKISNFVCLSDVLKITGYYMVNIGADYELFAGRKNFMELHGYDKVYGKKEMQEIMSIPDFLIEGWGIKDIDLFNFAKEKFLELSE